MTASATRTKWVEVRGKCPICGKGGWCTRTTDGEVVKCMRAASDRPVKSGGWLHPSGMIGTVAKPAHLRAIERKRLTRTELADVANRLAADLVPDRLARFAERMGLSVKALRAYGVGYYAKGRAFSFPMVDSACKLVGFRLRSADPDAPAREKAKTMKNTRTGLFVPVNFDPMAATLPDEVCAACDLKDGMPLVILTPEGPTDAAAAFDLGYCAIGRPSCNGGSVWLRQLLHAGPARDVVVVADRDEDESGKPLKFLDDGTPYWPGLEGGVRLVEDLWPIQKAKGARLRFVQPPVGTKDLRDWLRAGVGTLGFGKAIGDANPVSDKGIERVRAWIKGRKRYERQPAA